MRELIEQSFAALDWQDRADVCAAVEDTIARRDRGELRVASPPADGDGEWTYVDVRTPEEFARGHVPGAYNVPAFFPGPMGMMPNPEFAGSVRAHFAPDRALVMGCAAGGRSMHACEQLAAMAGDPNTPRDRAAREAQLAAVAAGAPARPAAACFFEVLPGAQFLVGVECSRVLWRSRSLSFSF